MSLAALPRGFPKIVEKPMLQVIEKKQRATMKCRASGNPKPKITWMKDFLPVDTGPDQPRLEILPSEYCSR